MARPRKDSIPDSQLVEMYQQGMTSPEIAKIVGLTEAQVHGRLYQLRVLRTRSDSQVLAIQSGRKAITAYWTGKTIPPELVEKRAANTPRGKNHPQYKDGTETRGYRKKIKKVSCETCGATENLCIHHRDLDHYNNDPKNLQVLCVSCHMSLHKKLWWEAKKAGKPTPKSTGKSHW